MNAEEVLAKLREADEGREAPLSVEAAVLAAFRRERPRRQGGYLWTAAAAAAVLLAAAALFFLGQGNRRRVEVPATVAIAPPRDAEPRMQPVVIQPVVVQPEVRHRERRRRAHPASADSFLAQFDPVPYSPPLPSDEIRIVRVRIEPEVPLGGATREADVIAGADGIVRAVRWVR